MSDLGQLLISISDKLSKLISRTNKLERNIYKIARSIIPTSIAAGDLPVKQLDMTECLPKVNESTRQNRDDKTFIPNSITTSIPNMNVTEWVDPPLDKFTKYDQECL